MNAGRARGRPLREHPLPAALVVSLALVAHGVTSAETSEGEQPETILLEPQRPAELVSGSMALAEGEADAEGLEFALPDLSVMQPVEVRLTAVDANRPVSLEITKFGHDGVLREATTETGEDAVVRFRTQLGVGLTVRATQRDGMSPFQLLVWVGDEVEDVPRDVFVPAESRAGTTRPGLRYGAYTLAAGGILALGLLMRKSRRST